MTKRSRLWDDEDYLSKIEQDLDQISNKIVSYFRRMMEKGKPTILVLFHGREHKRFKYLPKYSDCFLVDNNPMVRADLCYNILTNEFFQLFRYQFDQIYLVHPPLGDPLDVENDFFWRGLWTILEPEGKIYDYRSVIGLYHYHHQNLSMAQLKRYLRSEFGRYFPDGVRFIELWWTEPLDYGFGQVSTIQGAIELTKYVYLD